MTLGLESSFRVPVRRTRTRAHSSFPRKRESRVFAFPVSLDAGSGSGMTVDDVESGGRDGKAAHNSLPTACAMRFRSCINALNRLGLSDSSPSQRAHSGFEWTSIRSPSAPAAMAALAMGATRAH